MPALPAILNRLSPAPPKNAPHFCPICDRAVRRFVPRGKTGENAGTRCPRCRAHERHRLIWLTIINHTNILNARNGRVLHIAANPAIAKRLRRALGIAYATADLLDTRADITLDIQHLPQPDRSLDAIICSHVLEHVPDDRRAMRECARTLTPKGVAIILVPITAERTFEDPTVTDPEERARLFGQHDHVRRYGPDVTERLADAGLSVRTITHHDAAPNDQHQRLGLNERCGVLFLCAHANA